jgi:hypothetical protein
MMKAVFWLPWTKILASSPDVPSALIADFKINNQGDSKIFLLTVGTQKITLSSN